MSLIAYTVKILLKSITNDIFHCDGLEVNINCFKSNKNKIIDVSLK